MLVSPDQIRAQFSRAMSALYQQEVPLYGALLELVAQVNQTVLVQSPALASALHQREEMERLNEERHGAIRVGTARELATLRRLFAVMGMHPVGYYDLTPAGVPVHSTAFRAVHEQALQVSPFRVFTSLLRLELIEDPALREQAATILGQRQIFTERALQLIARHEERGGLDEAEANSFIEEALQTFRWHHHATVGAEQYRQLHDQHRLIADVVAFKGPHINHLTPRTLDIDQVQALMPSKGITPKATIEGPPPRRQPILLRQTSFKALDEPIAFQGAGGEVLGSHTARFGEIEQRGAALTAKGRALYDQLLARSREAAAKLPGQTNGQYLAMLGEHFREFPDDLAAMREQGLAYFRYQVDGDAPATAAGSLKELIEAGHVQYEPLVYEDFLPVSAAGIFQSNLGDSAQEGYAGQSNRADFEAALGATVLDELTLYAETEQRSLAQCAARLGRTSLA
jgi:uncharacterized glyoxalase superfamily metalloenzyme YdcJ